MVSPSYLSAALVSYSPAMRPTLSELLILLPLFFPSAYSIQLDVDDDGMCS